MAWPACLVFSQQRHRRANLTRGAIPALHSIMANKCGLHWVQDAVFFQALYGHDLIARMHHGERQAAVDALSTDYHRAGAALSLLTTLLRTGQPQMLAQRIEQCYPRIEMESMAPSIDGQRHVLVVNRCRFGRGLRWRRPRSHGQSRCAGGSEEAPPRQQREKRKYPFHGCAYDCVLDVIGCSASARARLASYCRG
jgi:hypothetical protein